MIANPISESEYANRIARVREALDARSLDALIAYGAHRDYRPADLRYLARWFCVEEETSALFVPREGPTTLLTDVAWDIDRARREAFADQMRFTQDFGTELAALISETHGERARVGIAGYQIFPTPVYLTLVRQLGAATFTDASELTAELRMVKSPAELDLMRTASRISDEAMAAGIARIGQGTTEIEVAAVADAVIRAAGAEPSFVILMGGGERTVVGAFPSTRTLRSGEFALLDCGARVQGYHGDMCRTVVVGEPDAGQRRKLEAVEDAVKTAIAAIKPGVTVGAIREAAAQAITEAGYQENWWDVFMPHGNGTEQHEPPDAKKHPALPLQEHMVLCIEPGISVPGEGVICIEQMIAVTADGAEVFNHLPTNMWDHK